MVAQAKVPLCSNLFSSQLLINHPQMLAVVDLRALVGYTSKVP